MKKFTLLASLLMFVMLSYAANVIPVEDAMKASKNFLTERVGATKANQLDLVLENTEYSADGIPVSYRFRVGNKGFIIVSANELANPVLAFSLESDYNADCGAEIYNKMYTKSLEQLINNPSKALPIRNSWDHYLASDFQPYAMKGDSNTYVEPLVTTTWTQERFYNSECPYNPRAEYKEDSRAVVGCVALTMANILFYYRYPEHGTGAVSYIPREYDHETGELIYTYPTQTVNYALANYDYNAMANSLKGYDNELAKLIYHCGVSTLMKYGSLANEGSGTNAENALTALQTYYYFNPLSQMQTMDEIVTTPDQLYIWVNKAKDELDAHRPIFYAGNNDTDGGGHAWIVDGYITIGNALYFHVNWGWAGNGNGYFLINEQISEGSGTWNVHNRMMINLMPDSAAIQKPAESFTRVTSSFGTISDGAGNMKYAQNSNRRWVLACPDAQTYRLEFSKLKVKSGDKVTVYFDGVESDNKQEFTGDRLMAACNDYVSLGDAIHANYVGTPLPGAITVTNDSVLIVFTSTPNSETDYGFVLDYEVTKFSKSDSCKNMVYNDQHMILTDKRDNVSNDEPYYLNRVCEYTLDLYWVDQLVYAFHKFDLGVGDFVDIYNQKGSQESTRELIAHYDIANPPTQVYTYDATMMSVEGQRLSRIIIRFASDNKDQGTGFEFDYYGLRTGINQYDNVDVNVYPNPASSYVNVAVSSENAQQFKAEVVDIMGKTVYTDQFNHNGGEEIYQIPVNNLAKGVYFLHLNSANGSNIQKFVVR